MAPEARGASFCRHLATIVGAVVLIFAAAYPFAAKIEAAELERWSGGSQPTFTLATVDGGDVALRAQQGNPVLVHFFATWCEPCVAELSALNRLSERARASLKVLAISVAEADARVRRFTEATPVSFPILLDRDRAVTKAWKVSTLPTTFILDAQLQPRLVVEADYAWDTVDPKHLITRLSTPGGHNQPQQQSTLTQNKEDNSNELR